MLSPTIPKTPMEHISIQMPQPEQSSLSMYTSTAMVAGAEISKSRHTSSHDAGDRRME